MFAAVVDVVVAAAGFDFAEEDVVESLVDAAAVAAASDADDVFAVVAITVAAAVVVAVVVVAIAGHALPNDADVFVRDDDDGYGNGDAYDAAGGDDYYFQRFALIALCAVGVEDDDGDDDAFLVPSPVGEALYYSVLIFLNIYLDTSSLILRLLYACSTENRCDIKTIYNCIISISLS